MRYKYKTQQDNQDNTVRPDHEEIPPYDEFECTHKDAFYKKGILTCKDCGCQYNETTLEWEDQC